MVPEELRALDGFNIQEGLYRLCDNLELYTDLITEFAKEYRGAASEFLSLMEQEDKEPVRRLVHTIKGISGNLAIPELHSASSELESAIKENRTDDIPGLFEIFRLHLDRTIHSIDASGFSLRNKGQKEGYEKLDRDKALTLLDSFIQSSGNRLARAASETLSELSLFIWPECCQPMIDKMVQFTKEYKLKEAAGNAERIREVLEGGDVS